MVGASQPVSSSFCDFVATATEPFVANDDTT